MGCAMATAVREGRKHGRGHCRALRPVTVALGRALVAEVELLTAVATFFKRLGVGPDIVGIRVNSRKVLDVAITKAGVPRDKFEKVCVVVDKRAN